MSTFLRGIALGLCCTIAASAAAQEGDGEREQNERNYLTAWILQPELDPEFLTQRTLVSGDLVLRQRLLPPTLARLSADAILDENGETVIPGGAELFGLVTAGPPIFCVAGTPDRSNFGQFMLGVGNTQRCLVDLDRDGRFDGYFRRNSEMEGLPNIRGRRPRNPDAIRPVVYELAPSSTMRTYYFAGIQYNGQPPYLRGRPTFSVVYGTEQNRGRLSQSFTGDAERYPQTMTVMGAAFTFDAAVDGGIEATVLRPMPPRPFVVIRTVS